MLGYIGGIKEAIFIMFGFFCSPISEFAYYNDIVKRLFMAKTRDAELFERNKTWIDRHRKH